MDLLPDGRSAGRTPRTNDGLTSPPRPPFFCKSSYKPVIDFPFPRASRKTLFFPPSFPIPLHGQTATVIPFSPGGISCLVSNGVFFFPLLVSFSPGTIKPRSQAPPAGQDAQSIFFLSSIFFSAS